MLWNNVETKPSASTRWLGPELLEMLGEQTGTAATYEGDDLRGGARRRARARLAARRGSDYAIPTSARTSRGATRARPRVVPSAAPMTWIYYLARICNHCTYPACLASCPRQAIYKRARGRHRARRPEPLPRLPGVRDRLPVQEGLLQPRDRSPRSASAATRRSSRGSSRSASSTASARSGSGWTSRSPSRRARQPDRLPRAHAQGGAAALPQLGLEPNVYYIPPMHVPADYTRQMFGPGVEQAIETYLRAKDDPEPLGRLTLFGGPSELSSASR